MTIRIKVVQAQIQFQAVAIDDKDNVYPLTIDPLTLAGMDFPGKLVREWPTALRALERQENEKLTAAQAVQPRAARRAKKRTPAKRANGSAPR